MDENPSEILTEIVEIFGSDSIIVNRRAARRRLTPNPYITEIYRLRVFRPFRCFFAIPAALYSSRHERCLLIYELCGFIIAGVNYLAHYSNTVDLMYCSQKKTISYFSVD